MHLFELLKDPTSSTLATFLELWHGPPSRPAEPATPGALPNPIREFAALVARWPSVFAHNRLASDPDWGRDGDKRVFYVENQGVFLWATDGRGSDPLSWGRINEPEDRWQAEREPLSRFLLQVVLFEATLGAPVGALASGITLAALEAATGPLEPLPLGSWRWPAEPTWFYAGRDVLAVVNPSIRSRARRSDRFEVVLGARSVDALSYLKEAEPIRWDSEPP